MSDACKVYTVMVVLTNDMFYVQTVWCMYISGGCCWRLRKYCQSFDRQEACI